MLRNQNISNQAYISESHKWKFHKRAPLEANRVPLASEVDLNLLGPVESGNMAQSANFSQHKTTEGSIGVDGLASGSAFARKGGSGTRSIGIQTEQRDSETQTIPYTPKEYVLPGTNPEVLKIKHFTYGKELPPTLGGFIIVVV